MRRCFETRILHVIIGMATIFVLGGCGAALNPYEENFKCRAPQDGGECIDTTTAYSKAVAMEQHDDKLGTIQQKNIQAQNTDAIERSVQEGRYKILARLLKEPKTPMLEPARILRVLLLPYKGRDNELFMSRYVYLKVRDSQWVLTDLGEIDLQE